MESLKDGEPKGRRDGNAKKQQKVGPKRSGMGSGQSRHYLTKWIPREGGVEVTLSLRRKPLIFDDGRRVDTFIVDDTDYFFYHFFRMLEVMVNNSIGKIATPRSSPRPIGPHSSSTELQLSGMELNTPISNEPKPLPLRATAALSDYCDYTGFTSVISIRDIRTVVEACFLCVETANDRVIRDVVEMIHYYTKSPAKLYFYNYRPLPQSTVSIVLAKAMGWHERWFQMPGSFLYINEWKYLVESGVCLYAQASTPILAGSIEIKEKPYFSYFAYSLIKDRSNMTIREEVIRKNLSLIIPTEAVVGECLGALQDVAGKLSPIQQITHNAAQRCLTVSQ